MNKMAIFVEGRTELEFDSKLIQEIASHKSITIETRKVTGGSTVPRRNRLIETIKVGDDGSPSHFFLLFDCGNEDLPKQRMREEYDWLARNGYSHVVCHRDVAPTFSHSDIPALVRALPLFVKTKPIPVTFVLSVMEVEAWFLAEFSHFERIDPSITVSAIASALGFDPSADDLQLRPAPATDLSACYALAGRAYNKRNSQRTIDALDFVSVYCDVSSRFSHLETMCQLIANFLD